MLIKQFAKRIYKIVICFLLFTIHYSLFTIHIFAACSTSSTVTAKIGSPANGANNCIDISWTGVTGAVRYRLYYSTDNVNWKLLYTGSCLSYHHICGQAPNAPFYYRVSDSTAGAAYCTPADCSPFPIYTACNAPVLKVLNTLTYSLQLTFLTETPVANPAYTQYAIYCKTTAKYVQANGLIGSSTPIYQTKILWGNIIYVSGLTALTQYCFYAIAQNGNKDIRYNLTNNILVPLQTFNTPSSVSNYNCVSYADHSKWNLCTSIDSPSWIYSDTVGCPGGGISYKNKGSNFVYSPYFHITGLQYVLVSFNISNSFNSSFSQNAFQMYMFNDSVFSTPTITNMNFDRSRKCEYDEISFSTNGFPVNHNEIYMTTSILSNSPVYSVNLDNITITGQSITLVCATTRQICTVPKIAVNGTNQSKCIGEKVTFSTTFTGTDTLHFQWKKNSNNIQGATTSSYMINSVALSDSGKYSCYISNFCGNASSNNVKLLVNSPITINIIPDNPVKCSGDSIIFKLALTGSPQSYIWKKGNNIISGATTSSYTILNISAIDYDIFSCTVSNFCNTDSSSTILYVKTPASINITPLTITKYAGDSILFSLSPNGTPPFSYQWYRNDTIIPGATGDFLNIKPIKNTDAGVYSCNISNICGSTMHKISTLIVNNGNLYTLSGTVTYDNTDSTPLNTTTLYLYLKSDSLNAKDSANTDSTGYYIFSKVAPGEYIIKIKTFMPWGGVNPIDALMINRYFIKIYNFTDALTKRTADVNNDGKINPIDALLVNRRYIKQINKFSLPDWLFDNQSILINTNTTYNIKAICAGDVNASY